MSNIHDDMRAAVEEAKMTFRAADDAARSMALILRGRLKHVPSYILKDLKRELRDFNITTGKWGDQ